jgi:predicted 3-demethylubiquinone-9 3-methyltransferase (glyoxalase superfamily)
MSISTCLWYVGQAEEAANFYVSLLPDSRVDRIIRYPIGNRNASAGSVLTVEFTLAGQSFFGLNGFEPMEHTFAMSIAIDCDSQAEIDRLWAALLDGGEAIECGWIKDRYGVNWQITPKALKDMIADTDREAAARAMQAMLGMKKIDLAALQAAFDDG